MKKILLAIVVLAVVYIGVTQFGSVAPRYNVGVNLKTENDDRLANALAHHQSNVQVRGSGLVVKILADDRDGNRHQRFIVRLESGQTILIAHNIDLANRVDSLKEGDWVEFEGEYEWNPKGGVIHWTHRDPHGHHLAGWIKHNGQTYQ